MNLVSDSKQPASFRGPRPIDELIGRFVREHGLGKAPGAVKIFRAWNDSLEPALRKQAQPVRFRAGELVVEVASASYLQEFKNFIGEGYRQRANERLRTEAIRKVVFKLKS